MDQIIVLMIAVATSVAVLTLISLGLAVIFGMMRVINFAHGEFIMLGGYATVVAAGQGLNIWIAILVAAPGYFGGDLSFGALMMVVGAFIQVQGPAVVYR